MNTVQKIAKNVGFQLLSEIINKSLAFFYIMYMARYLGAEGYGTLSFAIAFSGIFSVFADLGLKQLTIRDVARNNALAGKYLGNVAITKIVLTIITFFLISLVINLFNYPEKTVKIVYLIYFSVIFFGFTELFNSIFQAFEKMEYSSMGTIVNSILMFSGIIFAIQHKFDITGFAYIYLITSIIVCICSFLIFNLRFQSIEIKFDSEFCKHALREALPFGVSGIFIMIYFYISSVMLSYFKGNEAVGWYSVSYNLVFMLLVIPIIVNNSLFPVMSRFYISSKGALMKIVEKYFKLMLMIVIPLAIGTTLLADKIILSIYGQGYYQSIIALQILVWAIVFTFSNAAFVKLLESTNKQIIITLITGICMIENVILNLLIIPKYSYIGASFNSVITEFTVAALALGLAYKIGWKFQIGKVLIDLCRIIIAGLIMGLFAWHFRDSNLLILITFSAMTYFISFYIIGGIDSEDINIFKLIVK